MAEKKALLVKLMLGSTKGKLVRFSYLNVHEPRLNTESNREEYSVTALIPKANVEDIKAVKDAIEALKKDTWLDDGKKIPPQFWNPLKDGDNDCKQDGSSFGPESAGHYILNCKTGVDSAPSVVGTTRGGDGKLLPVGKSAIKSGDWGRISVNLGAYTKGTGGVGAYLSNLQFVQQGDPLGNKSSAEDDFSDFDEEDDLLA